MKQRRPRTIMISKRKVAQVAVATAKRTAQAAFRSKTVRIAGITAGVGIAMTAGATAGLAAWLLSGRKESMQGKVVVITGGSRGLGLEIARQFGLAGAHLVLAARDEDELQAARVLLARERALRNVESIETVVADVSTREGAAAVVSAARQRYGRIDVLINNAGVIHVAPFSDQPEDAFEEAMQTNFFGALYMIQAVVGEMRHRHSGSIVNIASIGGKIAVPHMLPYVASKFALVGLSQGLHAELAKDGITVTTVCPGLMRTGSHVQAKFGGRKQEEYRWFAAGATIPGISISARRAAGKIFHATTSGRAEITITPQAWLAARIVGVAPECAQRVAAMVNRYVLPEPNGDSTAQRGAELPQPDNKVVSSWNERLQLQHNQIRG